MPTPFEAFKTRLGIGRPTLKGVGFNYTPTIMQQGQTADQYGQNFLDRTMERKNTGQDFYNSNKQENMTRLASDLSKKSAGLKFDEWGKPEINLADFGTSGQSILKSITQRGNIATQTAENKAAYANAVNMQGLSVYGISGNVSISGTDIPGASSDNPGAQVASMAMQVQKNGTPYVYGGNSLSSGIDCSGLVQQLYRKLGINLPRTTYEQAKTGRAVSVSQIRPGDLVFYGNDMHHVGIYYGNGKIVHAANSKLGVIISNLTNSNGAPSLIIRPY